MGWFLMIMSCVVLGLYYSDDSSQKKKDRKWIEMPTWSEQDSKAYREAIKKRNAQFRKDCKEKGCD